jgi:hypothetical protein
MINHVSSSNQLLQVSSPLSPNLSLEVALPSKLSSCKSKHNLEAPVQIPVRCSVVEIICKYSWMCKGSRTIHVYLLQMTLQQLNWLNCSKLNMRIVNNSNSNSRHWIQAAVVEHCRKTTWVLKSKDILVKAHQMCWVQAKLRKLMRLIKKIMLCSW